MCVCMTMFRGVCVGECIYVCICMYVLMCMCQCVCECMCEGVRVYDYVRMGVYAHVFVCIVYVFV